MPAQAIGLRRLMESEQPDVIVVDSFFFGATALYLDRHQHRPPIIACGITVMTIPRSDGAPSMLGLPPARDSAEMECYAALAAAADASFTRPLDIYANTILSSMRLPALPCSVLPSRHLMADVFLQPGIPAFEYDAERLPAHVRFVGALCPPHATPLPPWWDEIADGGRIVVVTQGTVANLDFGELLEPCMAALAARDDLHVLVTTGHRPLSQLRGPVPRNTRLAEFLDFATLLPRTDLLVTNGGYGTVMLALAAGVPIVAAGRSEDKAEVGARVAWSGVGMELPHQRPKPEDIASAVAEVLDTKSYRDRARAFSAELARIPTSNVILDVFETLDRSSRRTSGARS